MVFKFYVLTLLVILGSSTALELQTINGTIKITTVTTAGCSDTVSFITNQLAPAYEKYRDFLELEFVPWGRTTYINGEMWCQFGANDCWANRLHRCALDQLKNDQDAQMKYMACEFSRLPAYFQQSYLCAAESGLNLVEIDYCVNDAGGPLDDAAELAAKEPMAIINFVPAIVLNDDISTSLHSEARLRLNQLLCLALANDPTTGITSCSIN